MANSTKGLAPLLVAVIALGLTLILAAGLQEHRFRPGAFRPPLGPPTETVHLPLSPLSDTVLNVVKYAIWAMAGLGILILLFSRKERRKILWIAVPIMVIALMTLFFPAPQEKEILPQLLEVSHEGLKTEGNQVPSEPETTEPEPLAPPRLPSWPLFLLLGGLVFAATFWFLWGRNRREVWEEKRKVYLSPPSFPKLEGVVTQAWWRMVERLSVKAGMAGIPKTRTARELAEFFFQRFSHPAIWELTGLFEEVRYGERSDAELAGKARAALAKIEELE